MAVPPNTGMKTMEMRKLLVRSKEEPVTCAVGQGDNGGLMLLDKRKPGRALETALKAEFPDARNTRFGTAFVDVDDNPKLVKLTLNKPVTGMAKRLIKTLKGTGFNKVVILMEDGSLMEQFEEEDAEAPVDDVAAASSAAVPPAPPPPLPVGETAEEKAARSSDLITRLKELSARIPAASHGDPTRLEEFAKLARMTGVQIKTGNLTYATNALAQLEAALAAAPPPPPAPPPPAPPTANETAGRVAELTAALRELVPQIAGAAAGDAARLGVLAKLAKDAGVEIKTGNLTYAANTIERLRAALQSAPAAGAAGPAPAAIAASRVSWTNMRAQVSADVDSLRSALSQAYAGQPAAERIASAFQAKVAPVLGRFDDRLGAALDGMTAETDAGKRAELAASARALAGEYRAFAEGDALIGDLDDNPFVPLQIRGRTVAALSAVESALG